MLEKGDLGSGPGGRFSIKITRMTSLLTALTSNAAACAESPLPSHSSLHYVKNLTLDMLISFGLNRISFIIFT